MVISEMIFVLGCVCAEREGEREGGGKKRERSEEGNQDEKF